MATIQFENVSFEYRSFSLPLRSIFSSASARQKLDTLTLNNINLHLESGKFISLVGPNGAGKTTLLNLISGLTKPSSGSISRTGVDSVSYVSQMENDTGWMPITVSEILKMSSYRRRGYFKKINSSDLETINRAAERMEVGNLMNKQFNSLSVGERQRVRVSLALSQEPDVLVMDEPLSGLDIPSQDRIRKVAVEEKNRGAAVAIATHSLEEASQADEVFLMDGSIVAQGEPSDILTEENLRSVYQDRLQILSDSSLFVVDHH